MRHVRAVRTTECIAAACKGDSHDNRQDPRAAFRALAGDTFAGSAVVAPQASAQQKTLKFVPEADLRILDPIATTAYITRNYAYMVYDTLFSVNEKFEVQPQMVEKWTLSDDKLTYTFTLRDGLKFHDGAAVNRPTASPPSSVGRNVTLWVSGSRK